MTKKHYKQRDAYEIDYFTENSYYSNHVSAMTGEQLHSKSDICGELAIRDLQIDWLIQNLSVALGGESALHPVLCNLPEFEYIDEGGV